MGQYDGIEDDDYDLENKDYSGAADAVLGRFNKEYNTDRRRARYADSDFDEYAVRRRNPIHSKLDSNGMHRDLDLYDIFKDFDRDGDGIVEDIDMDDPRWTESAMRNGWNVDDEDASFYNAGRYRGLTEEQWAMREK